MKPPAVKRKLEESNTDKAEEPMAKKVPSMFFGESDAALDKRVTEAIINFLADSGVAFSVVGRSSFIDLVKVANKRIKLKSPKTYMRLTKVRAEEIDQSIRDIIKTIRDQGDIKSVSFTTDIWTSRSQDSYISLTIHFIDRFWHLHRWTPFVKPFPERHTGKNISLGLEEMIQELNLLNEGIDLVCVNDNASNMKLGIKLTPGLDQYLCDIHTVELCLGDTYKVVEGMTNVLKKSRALSKFTHQSNVALEELKKEAAKEGVPFRKLKNPPDTRWSGRYDNLVSVFHLRKPIKNLCEDNDGWAEHTLSRSEWKLLEGAVTCLKPVKMMIKALEGEKEPTINKVISEIFKVQTILRNFINTPGNCGYGIGFAKELKAQIEKRFPDKGTDRVQRRMANYLSPDIRGAHIDKYDKLESTKVEIEAKIKSTETVTEDDANETMNEAQADASLSPNSKFIKRHQEKMKRERTRSGLGGSKVRKEMERYEGFTYPGKNTNILLWWKQHEGVLPLLASLAKRILAIPASSAKSERVFSTGGNIVTAKRNRLAPKNVENLIKIKENMSKVEDFLKNGGYQVTKSGTNPFNNIEMEGTPRDPEEDNVGEICINDMEEEDIIYLEDAEEEDYSDEEDTVEDNNGDPEDVIDLDF